MPKISKPCFLLCSSHACNCSAMYNCFGSYCYIIHVAIVVDCICCCSIIIILYHSLIVMYSAFVLVKNKGQSTTCKGVLHSAVTSNATWPVVAYGADLSYCLPLASSLVLLPVLPDCRMRTILMWLAWGLSMLAVTWAGAFCPCFNHTKHIRRMPGLGHCISCPAC